MPKRSSPKEIFIVTVISIFIALIMFGLVNLAILFLKFFLHLFIRNF